MRPMPRAAVVALSALVRAIPLLLCAAPLTFARMPCPSRVSLFLIAFRRIDPAAGDVLQETCSGDWLSKVEGLPRAAWPGWAKSAEKRARVVCHGAAATSSQAAALGVAVPRGCATAQLSHELCLRGTVCLLSQYS